MEHGTVDFSKDDRGVLFNADEEAKSAGWATHDPYPHLIRLLEEGPVHKGCIEDLMGMPRQFPLAWHTGDQFTVTSFDAVNTVFMSADTFNSKVYDHLSLPTLGDTLLNNDGERHRRMRNVAKPWFKPSFADGWWTENWTKQAVAELFDRITEKDHADLNLELCAPLPMSVVSMGFGLPMDQALEFRKAIHEVMSHKSQEAMAAGMATINRIFIGLMEARRTDPQDDLISRFVHADFECEDGSTRKLENDEILRYCLLIIHAGGGTTWRQLGTTIKLLLDHPEQMEALRADRSLLRATIQESTRLLPTDPVFLRTVIKDTEVQGMPMKAGDIVFVALGAANRDRTQWDDADSFNIHRPLRRNFAFGAGAHACLGQHLSRVEMEVALNAILDRLPGLRWDSEKPASRMSGGTLVGRGPDALHVRFDRA